MTVTPVRPHPPAIDEPRRVQIRKHPVDRIFHWGARSVGLFVLVLVIAIGVFLGLKLVPTVHHYGIKFFTSERWDPERNRVGIAAAVVGTIEVAIVALAVAFPLALSTALFITEISPRWMRPTLVSLVDLMSAVPSIIYGAWGWQLLAPHARDVARWLASYLAFIPIFKVDADPHSAAWAKTQFQGSVFIAGIAVAMMVTPLSCSVMRNVFSQAPVGEREAALALGSTRWGVIRAVVLPFGRGGIIGGTMLGLGRALGETVAVLLIASQLPSIKIHILQTGFYTVSSLIANFFGEATSLQLSALLAAGFVLFVMTLAVNTVAGVVVTRSRSGTATEI